MKHSEAILVECYAGYKGEESPRRFSMQGKEYEVCRIIARWYERGRDPEGSQRELFRVLDAGKREHILRHTVTSDTWELVW